MKKNKIETCLAWRVDKPYSLHLLKSEALRQVIMNERHRWNDIAWKLLESADMKEVQSAIIEAGEFLAEFHGLLNDYIEAERAEIVANLRAGNIKNHK